MKCPAFDAGAKNRLSCGIIGDDRRRKFGTDLVGSRSNARPDPDMDAAAVSAEALHCFDGGFGNAPESAAPPGVCSAYDARDRIKQQQWRAIGRQHTERHARDPRNHTVRRRRLPAPPRLFDARHLGAVDLAAGH